MAFRELATWATGDPYRDTWGGSGLAALALWRWLQILDRGVPSEPADVDQVLHVATVLGWTRLYRGMVRVHPLLPGLPQLEEEIDKLSAHVAWKNNRKEAAERWFLNYVTVSSSPSLDDVDQQILHEMIASEMATPARLDLFRNKRLLTLVNTKEEKDKAAAELARLWRDPTVPPDVRADAGYELADYERMQPDRAQVLGVLDSVIQLAAIPQSRRRRCSAEPRCIIAKRPVAIPEIGTWKRSAATWRSCSRGSLKVSWPTMLSINSPPTISLTRISRMPNSTSTSYAISRVTTILRTPPTIWPLSALSGVVQVKSQAG
jgi:hypothetical protein